MQEASAGPRGASGGPGPKPLTTPPGDRPHPSTSLPPGGAGGLTFFAPDEQRLESGLYSRSYLENQVPSPLLHPEP